jgi:hypothetical protein
MYFMNGVHKALGPQWLDGSVMHNVFGNVGWSRWPSVLPGWAESLAGWVTLAWELAFPVLVLRPTTRTIALWVGAIFHVATGIGLELGMFQLYALCLYVPLLPWERWADRLSTSESRYSRRGSSAPAASPGAPGRGGTGTGNGPRT